MDDVVPTRRTAWGGSADTHNRLSFRCQSVVWFLTLRPGVVPGPVAGYLPEDGADCREVSEPGFRPEGEIDFWTKRYVAREIYRVLTATSPT